MATVSDSIEISAPAAAAFEAVSHLEQMGRFSPEATGGTWKAPATGPAVGAKFRGTNTHGKMTWSTTSKVVVCTPPSCFAFDVTVGPFKVARWQYDIVATESGCTVTETWTDQRSAFSKKMAKTPAGDREIYTPTSIRATLEKLKQHLEG